MLFQLFMCVSSTAVSPGSLAIFLNAGSCMCKQGMQMF